MTKSQSNDNRFTRGARRLRAFLRHPRKQTAASTTTIIFGGLLLLVLAGAVNRDREPVELKLHTVTHSQFRSEIKTEGRIESLRSDRVLSNCRFSTRILKIVPEGTWVRKGDVVCELDSSDIQEYLHNREVPLIRARATLEASIQDEQLLQAANDRRQSKAEFLALTAESELEEYEAGKFPTSLAKLEQDLALQADQLTAAQDEMNFTEQLWASGLTNERAVQQAAYDLHTKQERVRKTEAGIFMLKQFTHPRTELQLSFRSHDAQRGLLRTEISNSLAETKARLGTLANQQRLNIYDRYVQDTKANIEACTIRAPRDGQLMYENSWSDLSRGRVSIEEGNSVYYQQPIFSIPDIHNLKVEVSLHESLIRRVFVGMPVTVQAKGYENELVAGEVADISDYPRARSYYTPDVKDYALEIILKPTPGQREFLRLKTDTVVTLQIAKHDDALCVPKEAVVGSAGVNYVWRLSHNELMATRVTLGECDEVFACVEHGLNDGDRVALQLSPQQRAGLQQYVDEALLNRDATP